jgi:hypothetical protein
MMSFSDFNESKAIAALLCPLLRARSPKTPFRCLAGDDDEMFSHAFITLQAMGVRKRLLQSRRNYVIESILFSEFCFEVARSIIELHFSAQSEGAWTGGGEFKDTSESESSMTLGAIYGAFGKKPPGPGALLQIDITKVWNNISPFLENPATKLAAKRQADDKMRAELLKLRAQATGQLPPDHPHI